jgi:hypothetical protein
MRKKRGKRRIIFPMVVAIRHDPAGSIDDNAARLEPI